MEDLLQTTMGYATSAFEFALAWIINPANWSQFALLIVASSLLAEI